MTTFLNRLWYEWPKCAAWILWPFSLVYCLIVNFRYQYLKQHHTQVSDVPVIVVGNLTVGGTGKTPLVIALAEHFKAKGRVVGIVSRGYHASIKSFPHEVALSDTPRLVGDEPYLLALKTGVPVVVSPNRRAAVEYLIAHHQVDLILSDDGLQHYAMRRAIEIAVLDGERVLGNGYCLPAGPLREPRSRLRSVDLIVSNGKMQRGAHLMTLVPSDIQPNPLPKARSVAAIAGIGHPKRFFDTLTRLQIRHKPYIFSDHHPFTAKDLEVAEDVIIMTEKDAVKCRALTTKPVYVLPVEAHLADDFWQTLQGLLEQYEKTSLKHA